MYKQALTAYLLGSTLSIHINFVRNYVICIITYKLCMQLCYMHNHTQSIYDKIKLGFFHLRVRLLAFGVGFKRLFDSLARRPNGELDNLVHDKVVVLVIEEFPICSKRGRVRSHSLVEFGVERFALIGKNAVEVTEPRIAARITVMERSVRNVLWRKLTNDV